jgi:hypothetical protein
MKATSSLLVMIALTTLVACGTREGSVAGGPPSNPDEPVSSTPIPGWSGRGQRTHRLVVPEPGMDDVRPIRWQSVRSVDARTLMVRFTSGVEPCYVLDHVDVEYGRKHVAITLFEGHDPQVENVACIEVAELKRVRVELAEPLGGRRVVDGAAG